MKRSTLCALFLTTSFLAGPAFSDDLCQANLQKVKDSLTSLTAASASAKKDVEKLQRQAMAAQAKGMDQQCVGYTNTAIKKLDDMQKGGEGGAG